MKMIFLILTMTSSLLFSGCVFDRGYHDRHDYGNSSQGDSSSKHHNDYGDNR